MLGLIGNVLEVSRIESGKETLHEATRAIRALPDDRAQIRIIAMTANAFAEDQQAALDAGMDGYATKPMEPEKLLRLIADLLPEQTARA